MLVARETGCLDSQDRQQVDEQVMGDPNTYQLGTRQLVGAVKRRIYAADPVAVARRASKAAADRCVTLRPAPDTMSYLTGHLPVAQGVAAYAALVAAALAAIADGDERGKGPSPAQTARDLVAAALDSETLIYLRRLYADPHGNLIAMSTRQQFTTQGLSEFLRLRDQGICRTPWCDAPIAHDDHITTANNRGETTAVNTQGLCRACNHAKQAIGWRQHTVRPPQPGSTRHTVETITPTGHRHRSVAPRSPVPSRRQLALEV